MPDITYLIAALFLPLFPFSMVFSRVYCALSPLAARVGLLLAWPQIGVFIAAMADTAPPDWFIAWALFTSALYALRVLVVRDMPLWIGFIGVSSWALLWIARQHGVDAEQLQFYALGISMPLVLLSLLGASLERRFGAAYAGLYGGLGQAMPRFSAVLVFVVLAAIATPLFPPFAVMIATLMLMLPAMPTAAIVVGVIWLLWTWAGARLVHGFVVGPASEEHSADDFGMPSTWAYVIVLIVLVAAGVYLTGELK